MSVCAISSEDKQYLEKLIKHLNFKCMQIVVQSRVGEPLRTKPCSRSELHTFRMTTNDDPLVQKEVAAAFNQNPSLHGGLVAEVSLLTNENNSLILEVWYLGLTKKCEDVSIPHGVYNRMTLLLKSLLCITRTTPAYKLSRQQNEEFVICYRIFRDNIDISGLGRIYKTMRVGCVATPIGTLVLSVAYRTSENIHVSTKKLSENATIPFEVKDDHFSQGRPHRVSPARPCHSLQSRPRTISEQSDGTGPAAFNVENSPSFNIFNSSFSVSPVSRKGKNEDNATFTVGTPPCNQQPAHRSTSSPMLMKANRPNNQFDNHSKCSPSCGNGFHAPSCIRILSSSSKPFLSKKHPQLGTSAPSEHLYYIQSGSLPKTRYVPEDRYNSVPTTPQSPKDYLSMRSTLTENIDNATNTQATVKATKPASIANWTASSTSTNSRSPITHSSSRTLLTGAFVAGTKTATSAQEKLDAVGSSNLPFIDLISAIEDEDSPDDNLSQQSDLNNSPSATGKSRLESDVKPSVSRKYSSSSLSSQESDDSSSLDQNDKQDQDDFVMVNVNPAFAKDSTCRDVGIFYNECVNAPELVMFAEHQVNETDETLLDLAKQLEDYEDDVSGFDQFVQELNVK